jgi:hypothetical protein
MKSGRYEGEPETTTSERPTTREVHRRAGGSVGHPVTCPLNGSAFNGARRSAAKLREHQEHSRSYHASERLGISTSAATPCWAVGCGG